MTALREDTPSVKYGVQKSYVSEVRKGFPDGYGEYRENDCPKEEG